jgi:peptidyl-tRNA hydrolase, PTH1 family
MRVVLGVGNPGREYHGTRHNLGFAVVDLLAQRAGVAWRHERSFKADVAELNTGGDRLMLIKPRTFVNLSGESAQAVLAYHRVPPTDLLVVVDDLNLPTGTLRLRAEGSAGGHNGLRDIEARLGKAYPRLRLGCGPMPPGADQVAFVLGGFRPDEHAAAEAMTLRAADACLAWAREGVAVACRVNGSVVDIPTADAKKTPAVKPPITGSDS